jgi:hypothetical protein
MKRIAELNVSAQIKVRPSNSEFEVVQQTV